MLARWTGTRSRPARRSRAAPSWRPPRRARRRSARTLAALRERLAELSDLDGLGSLLFWDQNVMMPSGGAQARAEQAATLAKLIHVRETDPELRRLLAALEPWTDGEDPDSDDVRLVRWTRRDVEK